MTLSGSSDSSSLNCGGSSDVPVALVDDPAWVLDRYEEAKELLSDIRADLATDHGSIEVDLHARIESFWLETFMDGCTTMGLDCGCNKKESR